MEKMRRATEYLQMHGVRPSAQRIAVTRFMIDNPVHPSAEVIYDALVKEMPTLSLATVYNTLRVLVSTGAVTMLNVDSRNARYDLALTPHAHFFCRKCGSLFDVPLRDEIAVSLSSDDSGFSVEGVDLCFKGLCGNCSSSRKEMSLTDINDQN